MHINHCYNCNDVVQSRKPTKSGASFCSRPECLNAKQRFFRQRWTKGLGVERDGDVSRAYIHRALHEERTDCPVCRLPDAVGPYIHRDARNPKRPCKGTGGRGPEEGLPSFWVDVVHPDLAARARLEPDGLI